MLLSPGLPGRILTALIVHIPDMLYIQDISGILNDTNQNVRHSLYMVNLLRTETAR